MNRITLDVMIQKSWAHQAIRQQKQSGTELLYRLILHHGREPHITLKLVTGPGDQGEPVVTIMLPDED